MNPESALQGTPYLIPSDSESAKRFSTELSRSRQSQNLTEKATKRIAREAKEILGPYVMAARTDLVAESNVMEGMNWTATEAQAIVMKNRELLNGPIHTLLNSFRSDPRVYEVLGLYRAHSIAEEWDREQRPPRVSEIRELQKVIVGGVSGAGAYKKYANAIGGAKHRPADPIDVDRVMLELADWWEIGTSDPILTATVVHAWVAHIHPFDDGNGRTARVLANLELSRSNYPPLIVRPESDRGEYYDALAASDEGDILPLYSLFVTSIRRQAKLMSKDDYVRDIIKGEFLVSQAQRYKLWSTTLEQFVEALVREAFDNALEVKLKGHLGQRAFALLSERDADGNAWFATIGQPGKAAEWLLWFGFVSDEMQALEHQHAPYPSIFISRRDHLPYPLHPYTPHFDRKQGPFAVPDELVLSPLTSEPLSIRTDSFLEAETINDGASLLMEALAHAMED